MSAKGRLPRDWELGVEDRALEDVNLLRDNYEAVAEAFRRRQISEGRETVKDPEDLYRSATRFGGYRASWKDFYRALEIMSDSPLPVERTGDGFRATSGYTPSDWQEILEAQEG